MTAMCAWCDDCLQRYGQRVGGWCKGHRCEAHKEQPDQKYPFVCDHRHGVAP